MNKDYEKIIQDAQWRKGASIAFFNSVNSAISVVIGNSPIGIMTKENIEETKDSLIFWRDWFLDEHTKYYAQNIANVGSPYNVGDAIARLDAVTSKDEMRKVWLGFSEDVRGEDSVIAKLGEIKKRYETL